MRCKFVLSALLLLFASVLCAQYVEKNWFNKTDSVYGYYVSIKPSSGLVQGALVLLDGYSGNADRFLSETKIHNVASANDILTICIPTGDRLYLDSSMTGLLNRLLKEIRDNYHLKNDQFAIGGMSSGGTIALRYVELTRENPKFFPIQFKACFDVDSPLDLVGLYKSSERDVKKNNGGWWVNESKWIIDRFNKELGNPNKDLKKYKEVSPFIREASDSLNESFLRNVAVRTYHDVDVSWHLQNRNRSLYETNMLNGSELISRLIALGNKQAEFVAAKQPGRNSDGSRHPHSWSIVDEIELIQWIKEKLNFYPDHISNPFVYIAPNNWSSQRILFPIEFAPEIPYKGFEELWFAPGWGNPNSNEKWAYTILWWLDDQYMINEKTLKENLEAYYSGLTRRRAVAEKQDMKAYFTTIAEVKKTGTLPGDLQSYVATASIYDAQVTKKPGKLYFKIHLKDCPDKSRRIVLIEVAGNSFDQPVWKDLDKINGDFECEKSQDPRSKNQGN